MIDFVHLLNAEAFIKCNLLESKSKGIAQFDHHDGVMHHKFLSWN